MRRPQEIQIDIDGMQTLTGLTNIFEGLASMRISQLKNQVQQSQDFFNRLWQMYIQIRAGSIFNFGRHQAGQDVINKELYIVITAEAGLSGYIDQKLINWMLKHYNKDKNEIVVIGHHGAVLLAQRGIDFIKYYKLPEKDQNINVTPIVKEVQKYASTVVFYQTYVSLAFQDVKKISLQLAVESQGSDVKKSDQIINDATYIFEPSTFAVIDHLERSMTSIAISQVILESKLAQYASRFQAMSSAHEKSKDTLLDLRLQQNRSKRAIKDERLKEVINGIRKANRL